jgi:hypothetical protein
MTNHMAKARREKPSPPCKNYPAYGYQQDNAAPRYKTNMPPPKYKTFKVPKEGIIDTSQTYL